MGRKVNAVRRINKNTIEFRPTYKIALSTMKGKRKITKVCTHLRNPKSKKKRIFTNWQAASAQASAQSAAKECAGPPGNQVKKEVLDDTQEGVSHKSSDGQKSDLAWPPGWPSGWDATAMQQLSHSQEQIEKELETFWDRGMKSRLSDLVKDAAEATGLTAREVKTWLTNKQKREKRAEARDQGIEPSRRPKVPLRKKRGYDLFMSDRMNQEDLKSLGNKQQGKKLKVAQEEWRALSDDEKVIWNQKAEIRTSEVVHDLDVAEQKLKQLKAKCSELWELGVNVTLMIPPIPEKDMDLQVFCPPEHRPFWEQSHAAPLLHEYGQILGPHDSRVASTARKSADMLRKEVQNIFNAGYEKATGRKRAFNYKEMDDGKIRAYGLPPRVVLKRPSAYNTSQKMAIIDNAARITFRVDDTDNTPVQPQLGVAWAHAEDRTEGAGPSGLGDRMDTGDERGRPGRSTRRKRTPRRKAAEQATFSDLSSEEASPGSEEEMPTYKPNLEHNSVHDPAYDPVHDPVHDPVDGLIEDDDATKENDIDLVGKEINHMWADSEEGKERKQWYRGLVQSRGDTHYAILYEGEGQPTQCPIDAVHEAYRQQSIHLIESTSDA